MLVLKENKLPEPPDWLGGFLYPNQDCNLKEIPGIPQRISDEEPKFIVVSVDT